MTGDIFNQPVACSVQRASARRIRRIGSFFLSVFVVLCFEADVQAQQPDPGNDVYSIVFPDLSSWNASLQLVRDPSLQEQTDTSPIQVARLRSLHADPRIEKLLRKVASEQGVMLDTRILKQLYWAMEEHVAEDLTSILDPKQFEKLRILLIRKEYPSGWSPFMDARVIAALKLPAELASRLLRESNDQRETVSAKVDSTRQDAVRRISASLPVASRVRLAALTGIDATPESQALAFGNPAPPFGKDTFTVAAVHLLLDSKSLRNELAISDSQGAELEDAVNQYSRDMRDHNVAKSIKERFQKAHGEFLAKARATLSMKQILVIRQIHTRYKFLSNFPSLFEDQATLEFLGLDREQSQKSILIARKESAKLSERVRRLNQEAFEKLSRITGKENSETLQKLFAKAWSED